MLIIRFVLILASDSLRCHILGFARPHVSSSCPEFGRPRVQLPPKTPLKPSCGSFGKRLAMASYESYRSERQASANHRPDSCGQRSEDNLTLRARPGRKSAERNLVAF